MFFNCYSRFITGFYLQKDTVSVVFEGIKPVDFSQHINHISLSYNTIYTYPTLYEFKYKLKKFIVIHKIFFVF